MTSPCFKLPTEVHEHLAEILERGGLRPIEDLDNADHTPGASLTQVFDPLPSRSYFISEGDCKVGVSSSFNTTRGCYTAHVLLWEGKRREAEPFVKRVERLLEDHGAVKV